MSPVESPTELEEVRQMPTVSRKLAVVAGFALAAGALGSGVAFAGSSHQAPPVRPAVKSAPAVVGSSSSSTARPAAVVKGAVAVPKAASSESENPSAPDTDTIQEGDRTSPDTTAGASAGVSGSEQESESATESDGPGGHEDPAGNVDHQFEGSE